jgi:flagellar biosynthesis regulator FlaF
MLFLLVVGAAAIVATVAIWVRRGAHRAWSAFALRIGGEYRAADGMSPSVVSGEIRSRPFLLETATSHEDDAGYYHTRGRVPVKNTGSFILGLRRKSLLEAAQTRGEDNATTLDDAEFERKFFIFCNDEENLPAVLTPEIRSELSRYHDIEIYVRMGEMEWRRAGEESDLAAIERLADALIDMAETIDRLPSRGRSLTQVLADEKMIEKGV